MADDGEAKQRRGAHRERFRWAVRCAKAVVPLVVGLVLGVAAAAAMSLR